MNKRQAKKKYKAFAELLKTGVETIANGGTSVDDFGYWDLILTIGDGVQNFYPSAWRYLCRHKPEEVKILVDASNIIGMRLAEDAEIRKAYNQYLSESPTGYYTILDSIEGRYANG